MCSIFFVPVEYMLVFQFVRIFPDVFAACKSITRLDVVECEEPVVFVTHVVHAKVHRRTVRGSGEHHVDHHARDIDLLLLRQWLPLGWLTPVIAVMATLLLLDSLSVLSFFPIEE